MKKSLLLIIGVLAVVGLCVGSWYIGHHSSKPHTLATTAQSSQVHYVNLSIALHAGKPVAAPQTFLVKQGTALQFTITSDVLGKVGAPVNPPQTITFTQSPLVFRFPANKLGTYPITYQAKGSTKVVAIGTVVVRAKN